MEDRERICILKTANPNDRIALRGVRVRSRLSGMSQRTTVEQTFVNREPRAIEAVYTFPLPDGAAVCGFEVVTGDRVLTGAVEETDRAIDVYEKAQEDGHSAFLMEQERPDVFTVRVGSLKPHQAATIRLTYVCALERVDRSIRLSFPTTIAPRYATASGTDPLTAMVDADALNPPHVLSVPYGITLDVEVALGRPVKGITSPSHSIRSETREDDNVYRVSFADGAPAAMDRDVVILLELDREHEPRVQVGRGKAGESYLAVTFVPEFEIDELTDPPATETFFVLDCSGSMAGQSIEQAKAALRLCLKSLAEGDTFNICRFGSRFEMLASEPLIYSAATLDRALHYVDATRDLGGTELWGPLEKVLTTPPALAGVVRQIILLTDGQVSNEPALVALARQHRGRNRIFTFGIGPASSSFLVKGLARATGGAAEFITYGERIEEKVLRTFGRIASPMATDVEIDWDGVDVQTLAELPPIFDGEVTSIFARAPGRLPRSVSLKCVTASGPKQWMVPVPQHVVEDDTVIATMWARRTIQSLEEVNRIQPGVRRMDRKEQTRDRAMLLQLSKEFGLICSLTSFVAVEHRSPEERERGLPALRRVPLTLATGWGALEEDRRFVAGLACAGAPRQVIDKTLDRTMDRIRDWSPFRRKRRSPDVSYDSSIDIALEGGASAPAAPVPAETPARVPAADELSKILMLQAADGHFDHDPFVEEMVAPLAHGWLDWRRGLSGVLGVDVPSAKDREHVAATVAVLMILRRRFTDRAAMWSRAQRKACQYLAKILKKEPKEVEAWLDEVAAKLPPSPEKVST